MPHAEPAAQQEIGAYEAHIAELEKRWSEALNMSGFDGAIVEAGTPRTYFLDDHYPTFQSNPHFSQWLPGTALPHSQLLVRPGQRTKAFILIEQDYWHAAPELPRWPADAVDTEIYGDADALQQALGRALRGGHRYAVIGDGDDDNRGVRNPEHLLHHLHFQRAVKTSFEIARLREAASRAVAGHTAARDAFLAGQSEYAIHLAYLQASSQTESELPYGNIIGLNAHAGVLHYHYFDRSPPAVRHSFLIDAGATSAGYIADVSRTYAAPGGPHADVFAALINAMDALQQSIIRQIPSAGSFTQLHIATHRHLARVLVDAELVSCTPDAAFEQGITRTFLPHGLGHLVGLQTHDVGGLIADTKGTPAPAPAEYPALRLTRPIEPGQVFTIEPGLYFIPMLLDALRTQPAAADVNWSAVDALRCCGGIRIEDNVHVTMAGTENLTREAFAAHGFAAHE